MGMRTIKLCKLENTACNNHGDDIFGRLEVRQARFSIFIAKLTTMNLDENQVTRLQKLLDAFSLGLGKP